MAVFPVEGGPANNIARPAIFPSWTILRIIPAAFRAFACPTRPCELARGSNRSSKPKPRICEWAPFEKVSELGCNQECFSFFFYVPMRSIFVMSLSSEVPVEICMAYNNKNFQHVNTKKKWGSYKYHGWLDGKGRRSSRRVWVWLQSSNQINKIKSLSPLTSCVWCTTKCSPQFGAAQCCFGTI